MIFNLFMTYLGTQFKQWKSTYLIVIVKAKPIILSTMFSRKVPLSVVLVSDTNISII